MALAVNKTLANIFGPQWQRVRVLQEEGGPEMYMAHDICDILGISNVTNAIGGIKGQDRVGRSNRQKLLVSEWNPRRKIHLLTLAGVFQLIMHNRNAKCMQIRNLIACGYLPRVKALKLH